MHFGCEIRRFTKQRVTVQIRAGGFEIGGAETAAANTPCPCLLRRRQEIDLNLMQVGQEGAFSALCKGTGIAGLH